MNSELLKKSLEDIINFDEFEFETIVEEETFDINYYNKDEIISSLSNNIPLNIKKDSSKVSKNKTISKKDTNKNKKNLNNKKSNNISSQVNNTVDKFSSHFEKEINKLKLKPNELQKLITSKNGPSNVFKMLSNISNNNKKPEDKINKKEANNNTNNKKKTNANNLVKTQPKKVNLLNNSNNVTNNIDKFASKENQTNKGLDMFIKSIKEKSKQGLNDNTNNVTQIVLLKTMFLNKYKFLFVTDVVNRLKLRDGLNITTEVLNDLNNYVYEYLLEPLFSINFDDLKNNEKTLLLNSKDFISIYENVLDILFAEYNNNNTTLINIVLESLLTIFNKALNLINKDNEKFSLNNFVENIVYSTILNIPYLLITYLKDTHSKLNKEIETINNKNNKINNLLKILIDILNSIIFKEIEDNEKIKNIKEENINIKYISGNSFCIKDNEKISFCFYSLNLLNIINKIFNCNDDNTLHNCYNNILKYSISNFNLENVYLKKFSKKVQKDYVSIVTIIFNKALSNFKTLLKISSLFDDIKIKGVNLNIKTTKFIENELKQTNELFASNKLLNIAELYCEHITNVFNFYKDNFVYLYPSNDNLNDELLFFIDFVNNKIESIIVLKYLIKENNINDNLDNIIQFNEQYTLKYIQFNCFYYKIYESLTNYIENNELNLNSEFFNKDEELKIYDNNNIKIVYYKNLLNFIFKNVDILYNINQSFNNEKFVKLLSIKYSNLINSNINTYEISKNIVVDYSVEYIHQNISICINYFNKLNTDLNNNNDTIKEINNTRHALLSSLKTFKNFKKFFNSNDFIISKLTERILNNINIQNSSNSTNLNIDQSRNKFTNIAIENTLLLSFINTNKNSNIDNYLKLLNKDEVVKYMLYFNSEEINRYCNYYITEEINNLLFITDELYSLHKQTYNNSNSINLLILEEVSNLNEDDCNLLIKSINTYDYLYSSNKISYFKVIKDLSIILKNKDINFSDILYEDFNNKYEIKSMLIKNLLVIFLLNILSKDYNKHFNNDDNYSILLSEITNYLYKICEDNNSVNLNFKKYNILDNIKNINSNINYQSNNSSSYNFNYKINSLEECLYLVINVFNFDNFLNNNKEYFNYDDISVEENNNVNIANINKENKECLDNNLITSKANNKINLDLITNILINIIEFFNNTIVENNNKFYNIYYYTFIQSFIINLISKVYIFSNLTANPNLLEKFISVFLKNEKINLYVKQENSNINSSIKDMTDKINLNSLCILKIPKVQTKLTSLLNENELYSLLLTKDFTLIKIISDELENTYKTSILSNDNEEKLILSNNNENTPNSSLNLKNIETQLKLLQDEDSDIDYLDNVIEYIFSKEVIKFIKFPSELFDYLQYSQDQLKYDIKTEKKDFYYSLYSYFYIWKTIMIKIEYGLKLYTSNKSYVQTIDKYKTILKFIMNYFTKNASIYEMFLLQSTSLIEILENVFNNILEIKEENVNKQDTANNNINAINIYEDDLISMLNNFNENDLKNSFDQNVYIFILSILVKFVKIFPTLTRYWFDSLKGKSKNSFKNIVHRIIHPITSNDLKTTLKNNKQLLSDKGFKIYNTELSNFFELDLLLNEEIKFNIQVKIPNNFPLKKLDIIFNNNVYLNNQKKLNIKMNLNQTLNMSTDNLCDNLIIWSENCKQFILLDVEPCPVCYYYLHSTDKSLPSLTCRQCKKTFHSLCIKEWFKNCIKSNAKTTCPMCRSDWVMKGKRDN